MEKENLKALLERKSKSELCVLSKSLNISGYSKNNKPELIESILKIDSKKVKMEIAPSIWDKYHNHFYGSITVLALLLSFLFYWFPKDITENESESLYGEKVQEQKAKPIDRDLAEALTSSLHELESNLVILNSISALYNERTEHKSLAKLDYSKSISFFTRYFDLVAPLTYGEEENLIPFLTALNDARYSLNSILSKEDVIYFNKINHLSMDDIRLLSGFYIYYIDGLIEEYLPKEFAFTYDKHDQIYMEKGDVLIMNVFTLDGKPVKDYSTVLDLLD